MNDSRPDDHTVDLLSPQALADPYPVLRQLRESDPIHWSEKYRSWFITPYAEVADALRDPLFTSNRITPYRERVLSRPGTDPLLREAFDVLDSWMVFKDPPDHTRLRRLMSRAFTPRSIARLRPFIDELANSLLDVAIEKGDGRIDLIADYAYPLTASVIAEMLGVPAADRDKFKEWSDQIAGVVFGSLEDGDRHRRGAEGIHELTSYLSAMVEEQQRSPSDNLISTLITARDRDDSLSHDEVISTGVLLLFAGHETTTNLIGNGISALLHHPDQQDLVNTDDQASMSAMVEEMLRFDGPAKSVVRLVTEDSTWHGVDMNEGDRVFIVLSGANRDPDAFEFADSFDVTRPPGRHLGFSAGLHFCLGAPLARLETSIAVPTAMKRLPRLREAPDSPPTWSPTLLTRGMSMFPALYDPS